MNANRTPYQLHLLTLSLWQEAIDGGAWEWRGEVKNTSTGELRYFRDWQMLVHLLPTLLPEGVERTASDEDDATP